MLYFYKKCKCKRIIFSFLIHSLIEVKEMKKLIPLLLLLTTLSVSFKDNKSTKFLYKYEYIVVFNP